MMLLSLSPPEIMKLIENYEKIVDQIKRNALTMAWYMRGGASYEDILNMSVIERNQISELIEKNLEVTKNSKMPFF